MGRHSRKGAGTKGPEGEAATATAGAERGAARPESGVGRRGRAAEGATDGGGDTPFSGAPEVRGGHPEQLEPGGGWGAGPAAPPQDGQARAGAGTPSAGPRLPEQRDGGRGAAERRTGDRADERQTRDRGTDERRTAGPRTGRQRTPGQDAGAGRVPVPGQGSVPGQGVGHGQETASGREPKDPAAKVRQPGAGALIPGPRREFVEAFGTEPADRTEAAGEPSSGDAGRPPGAGQPPGAARRPPGERPGATAKGTGRGTLGRTFTGIAAAAVTTVLAVVVAGQVAHDANGRSVTTAAGVDRDDADPASRSARHTPDTKPAEAEPLSYEEKMATPYPLDPKLKGPGAFEVVPGAARAPGKGRKYRYRIDAEKGLGLDVGLFAEAVQKTLNDNRSWAHNGAKTFERISSGEPDFVITLASPGTTGEWCEKSGLDTTVDNVSCDSAATARVMINAYRWAQGSATFGPEKLLAYRQMLINHEVGHRLGHNHQSCGTAGQPAPVMQQQTKSLDIDGIKCLPNPWVYPGS
ncbi:DUF3152 domain-containing protein [Streptomyces sp. DT171]|uniref:DUF3152 domain-containing protein n=1 Tax=Streptomyces sp. DT171 TaxID=3416524 RepID=UPI003CF64C90